MRPGAAPDEAATATPPAGPTEADPTRDDTDEGWGETPREEGREDWIRQQRPPHWG
jgi:hypothetical protein